MPFGQFIAGYEDIVGVPATAKMTEREDFTRS